jgi:hypothetical protein
MATTKIETGMTVNGDDDTAAGTATRNSKRRI